LTRRIAREYCRLAVAPLVAAYRLRMVGFRTVSELLSLVPGMAGVGIRRAWYERTLASCGERLYVDWGAVIRSPLTGVGNDVYIGPRSWIGECHVGSDTMLSGPTVMLSGARTHGMKRDQLIRKQVVTHSLTMIGRDVWTGSGAIIMADLAQGSVVGAGSVVTQATEEYEVVAGVPARKIGKRW